MLSAWEKSRRPDAAQRAQNLFISLVDIESQAPNNSNSDHNGTTSTTAISNKETQRRVSDVKSIFVCANIVMLAWAKSGNESVCGHNTHLIFDWMVATSSSSNLSTQNLNNLCPNTISYSTLINTWSHFNH